MYFPMHLIILIINQTNLNFSYRDSKVFFFLMHLRGISSYFLVAIHHSQTTIFHDRAISRLFPRGKEK